MNDLSNKYALAALKRKRATFAGEIVDYKKKIKWREEQLKHIDATIRVFEPEFDVETIPASRPQKRVKLFRQGELGRMLLDALRKADRPLSSREIADAVMQAMGHTEKSLPALAQRVRSNLSYHEKQTGRVVKVGKGVNAKWKLPDKPTSIADD